MVYEWEAVETKTLVERVPLLLDYKKCICSFFFLQSLLLLLSRVRLTVTGEDSSISCVDL